MIENFLNFENLFSKDFSTLIIVVIQKYAHKYYQLKLI